MKLKKTENRFVFIDTETGGIIPEKHSLLSIGLVVWDKTQGIIGTKEFFIKNEEYIVTAESKKINKFNIEEHEQKAKPGKIVIKEMLNFLFLYFKKDERIILVGHNVQFDINFLKQFMKKENRSYNEYFSHRSIDTYSIYKMLILGDIIEKNIESSAEAFS